MIEVSLDLVSFFRPDPDANCQLLDLDVARLVPVSGIHGLDQNTQAFMADLRSRISDHRIQLATVAYIFYQKLLRPRLAGDADFAYVTVVR